MAVRYLIASGNWSNTAIWSTSYGGAGGASVPGATDSAQLVGPSAYTVSLDSDTTVANVTHRNATLALSSYRLRVKGAYQCDNGLNAGTLNLGSGTLEIGFGATTSASFQLGDSNGNLTVVKGSSTVIMHANATSGSISVARLFNQSFNDFILLIGDSVPQANTAQLIGSPTFRSLIIQSKNSAAHTVNLDTNAQITLDKLVAVGSSTSNRLDINGDGAQFNFTSGGTSYGQYVDMGSAPMSNGVIQTGLSQDAYIGINSTGNSTWVYQDPPKVNTLVDNLTVSPASNTQFDVVGTWTQVTSGHGGGGYRVDSEDGFLTAEGTFDLVDSSLMVELPAIGEYAELYYADNLSMPLNEGYHKVKIAGSTLTFESSLNGSSWSTSYTENLTDTLPYRAIRPRIVASQNTVIGTINPVFVAAPTLATGATSSNTTSGITVTGSGVTANPDSVTINSFGVVYSTSPNPTIANSSQTGTGSSSSFNNTLTGLAENTTYYIRSYAQWNTSNYAYGSQVTRKTQGRPSVVLDTPANAGSSSLTKPTLDFTGTDPDTNTITYQIQLHTSNSWTSPLIDVSSASNTGFTNRSDSKTDPFYSGNQIRYTVQTDLTRGSTYYWRVRGKDTNGSNTWGEWTTARSFTVSAIAPTVTLGTVYNVGFDDADVDAEVTANGGATVTERGVVYSTSTNPTTSDSKVITGSGTGTFTSEITGLAGTTTYYIRAYAINSAGTSYSSQASFTTAQTPSAPTVITGSAANTTDITSEFNGSQVTQDGTATVTERGIVFSDTETTPDTTDRKIVAPAAGLGTYNLGMTGLDPETTYYVRAYAVNSIGTGYGDVVTFTTAAPYVPDEGDGYWTYAPSGSDAVIGRSQSTPANSSANLMLEDLGLEAGESYTLYYSGSQSTNGETKMVLQWFDGGVKTQQEITAGTPHTFVYDTDNIHWAIRLFVTGASAEANNINAIFSDMYLAKEASFSGYVPFIPYGMTEVKLENNWIADKQRNDIIGTMFDAIKGLSWTPFDTKTEGLGWFDIGDRFTIQDSSSNEYSVVLWNSKLIVDGSIQETLFTDAPDLTETNYSKAGKLNGLWKRTQIEVDKNKQEIESLVEAIYDYDGVINTQFSEVFQDVDQVRTTVQGSGGVNLIKNSVMYARDIDNVPENWTVTGSGTLNIQASTESKTAGAVAGNAFTLSDKTVNQTITVRKDVDFIAEDDKTYYSISAKVKKNTVGAAYIKLTNRNEVLTIDLPDQTSYYWDTVKIEEILPKDDYYDIEISSDDDADLQVTDLIFAPGKTKREWTQSNGEVMNSSVSVTEDGMTIRSPQFQNNFTKIDALGIEVHSKEAGGDRVFGFNGDETNVSKIKVDKQVSMAPLRTVPIDYGTYKGWAFTLSQEDS